MRTAWFDGSTGASGNMILGALLDAGLSLRALKAELAKLRVSGYRLDVSRVRRAGISGTQVEVHVSGKQEERRLQDILALIRNSRLDPEVKALASRVFERLAGAEARAMCRRPVRLPRRCASFASAAARVRAKGGSVSA